MTDLFPLVGAVAAMLAVLLPVVLLQGKGLRREMDHQRTEMASLRTQVAAEIAGVRADVADLRRDLTARIDTLTTRVEGLSERVARVEGALAGPWRPPNGNPAAAPSIPGANA